MVDEAKTYGFVRTKLGAVRHLANLLNSDDRYISSKAERQAVNVKIQGSSAEMTKKAEGRMWREGLVYNFDAVCFGPIHDETVFSVAISDLVPFLKAGHACMVKPYADMQVPIESSISFGPSFGVQFEASSDPVGSGMLKALKDYMEYEDGSITQCNRDAIREVADYLRTLQG